MRSAFYYPHTHIKNERILKTALLLWDELHVIAPWRSFKPHYDSIELDEAFSIIGKSHYPTKEEKQRTHEIVEELVKSPLPEAFKYSSVSDDVYEIYPGKLLPQTWEMLQDARLAGPSKGYGRSPTSEAAGLMLMSTVADCCAGESFVRVTDRGDAYEFIDALLTDGAPRNDLLAEKLMEVVPISLSVVNTDTLPLKSLLALRKREHGTGEERFIRELRHRFVDNLEKQAKQLLSAKTAGDIAELKRQFRDDVEYDYRALREALKLERNQVLTSREIITSALAAAGTIAAFASHLPAQNVISGSAAAITIGGLFASKSKFAATRAKVLLDHPISYIYESIDHRPWRLRSSS